MPPAQLRGLTRRLPAFIPAEGTARRRRVAMLEGCVQRVFFRDVNEATARVLAREGCDVIVPRAPAVLRRAQRARRPGTGGAEAGPSTDRRFRTRRRGRHRGERRRLRLHDEGVRPAAARRPEVRRTGGGVLGEGARHLGGARRPGARRAAAPHRGPGRLPRRLPSRARPGRAAPAAGGAAHHPGPGGDRHPGGRDLLRFGRHLQHGAARRRCRTGPAQDRQRHVGRAGRGGHRPIPDASCRCAGTCPGSVPMFHPIQLVDASIRGVDPIRAREWRATASYDARTPEPGRL